MYFILRRKNSLFKAYHLQPSLSYIIYILHLKPPMDMIFRGINFEQKPHQKKITANKKSAPSPTP